jgi:hypothetical protein
MPKTTQEILAFLDERIKQCDHEAKELEDYESIEDAYSYHAANAARDEAVVIHNFITGGDYYKDGKSV